MDAAVLKWAGGKRSLVESIKAVLPADYASRRYHEPFFGGGAVLFALKPPGGSVNDINPRLMNFYRVLRNQPGRLIEEAQGYRYEKEEYYRLRERFNAGPLPAVEDAALFLYLNKTGYNGLYRVNSKGKFNVPFGRYRNPRIAPEKEIREASRVLKRFRLHSEDFEYVLDAAKPGDVVYFDPPYKPLSKTSSFTAYHPDGFGDAEQERLSDLCVRLDERGVLFILSNSEPTRNLYDGFRVSLVKVNRAINSKASARGPINEILVTNIPEASSSGSG